LHCHTVSYYTPSLPTPYYFSSMLPPPPRSTLFPYTTLFRSHRIVSQIRAEARKIRFERIEQRKRLRRLYEVVVSSEADGVLVEVARHVVDQLKPRLPVKIRISPIHAEREGVRKLQVRLRGHGGEIKRPPGKLHAQF